MDGIINSPATRATGEDYTGKPSMKNCNHYRNFKVSLVIIGKLQSNDYRNNTGLNVTVCIVAIILSSCHS